MEKNFSKENAEKLIFGGIYTADPFSLVAYEKVCNHGNPWEQRTRFWVPVRTSDGRYYMVNTWQINRPFYDRNLSKDYQGTVSVFSGGFNGNGDGVVNATANYYYRAATKLNDENFALFKFVADLRDYRYVNCYEARAYNEDDVLENVRLYREHNYPHGICLVKKTAQKQYDKRIDALVDDLLRACEFPKVPCCGLENLERLVEEADANHASYNKEKVVAMKKILIRLGAISEQYREEFGECLKDIAE